MKNTRSINIFLLCFISMMGLWFVYHGIFASDHYNLNNNLMSRFPLPKGVSSLGGDFAYPWNGANNFIDPDAGVYLESKCFLPTENQCYHYMATPFVPLAFSGFTEFSYFTSYRVYLVLLLVLWGAGIYVMSRMHTFDSRYLSLFIAIVLFSCPFHYEFERGNWHSLVFLPVLLSFYLQNWKNDVITAAFFVTFAMFLKIHPGLFIAYFFIKGYFRTTVYVILFTTCFFFMSGGQEVYAHYLSIVEWYTAKMSEGGGWANHSTSSMLTTIIDFRNNSELKRLISYLISGILITGSFIYIFIMGKKSNSTLLKIELSMVLILANITPVTASRYSLIFMPFVMLTLIEALDHKSIKAKFKHYRSYIIWIIAIIVCYTFMSPLAKTDYEYNIISKAFDGYYLGIVRQLWFSIMVLFVLLIYFHWQIVKPDTKQVIKNPLRKWYETDLSLVVGSYKKLKNSFQIAELINLLDPVDNRHTRPIILIRGFSLLLFIYLIIYSIIGSALKI